MNIHLDLFLTFFKIGAFTFGGGYAMVPLIQDEAATRKHWISESDMPDILAISESTPGPIAINSATFVGYKTAGVTGSACATLGVALPSFLIIALLGTLLDKYRYLTPVEYAFFGIRAGVLALIVKALISMYRKCPKARLADITRGRSKSMYILLLPYALMSAAFILVVFTHLSSVAVLALCAGVGLLTYLYDKRRAQK